MQIPPISGLLARPAALEPSPSAPGLPVDGFRRGAAPAVRLQPPPPKAGPLSGRLEVDGTPGRPMAPGVPAAWTFRFANSEGQPVLSFEKEHEKEMHLVVVSEDLETFAHVHPALGPDGGFRLLVNQQACDPDNADAARVVTKPGPHLAFASIRPEGREGEVHRFGVEASGEPAPVPLVPDRQEAPGRIRKYFDSSGREAGPGAAFEVALQIEDHRRHGMFHLEFHLRQAVEDAGGGVAYEDVRDVEPWLGAPGHAVMMAGSGRLEDRFFGHLHAGEHHAAAGEDPPPGLGPRFRFAAGHDEMAPAGTYRVWAQFKQGGSIRTFPFTFALG